MIIFEAFCMNANIAFVISFRSFHVTAATFRLPTLWYYPMRIYTHHTECPMKHFEVFPAFVFQAACHIETNTFYQHIVKIEAYPFDFHYCKSFVVARCC